MTDEQKQQRINELKQKQQADPNALTAEERTELQSLEQRQGNAQTVTNETGPVQK